MPNKREVRDFLQKIIKRAARLFETPEYTVGMNYSSLGTPGYSILPDKCIGPNKHLGTK